MHDFHSHVRTGTLRRGPLRRRAGTLLAALLWALPLQARQAPEPDADSIRLFPLAPVVVEGRFDDLTGVARSASQGFVGLRDLRSRPLLREGELLETVPGLIMTQHSGDGKSNQMFVRGFNLDHGTDFLTRVEGMPVNLPTHGHGQGYTDLNFLIPEFVEHIEYQLGTYYAELGDFGAAGGAHVRMRRSLPTPVVSVGLGGDHHRRIVAGASTDVGSGTLLAGGELRMYDGPWARPQDLSKRSGILRYSRDSGEDSFTILGMGYASAWNASDQIPSRAVASGAIDRFAQIDSTLGGTTSRASLSASWLRDAPGVTRRLDLYAIHYDLELHSNFTYALEAPEEGDQFRQEDNGRLTLGANLTEARTLGRHTITLGGQLRTDRFDVALRHTRDRELLGTVRQDEGRQSSVGGWAELGSRWNARLRSTLALRGDWYGFDVTSDLAENSGSTSAAILSPKASLAFTATPGTELYLSAGYGFHSNDARGTVQTLDPSSGEAVDPVDPLVRARGAEVGLRATPAPGWRATVALWNVDLDSELLFVGDAGTTEASDASRRIGMTLTNVYRIRPTLAADLDVSLARARLRDVPSGEDRIPGAPEVVVAAGVTWEPQEGGPFASLRLRRFGSYPLVEDDSERAPAVSLVNLNLGWQFGGLRLGMSVLNLLDSEGADIQYLYESRLAGEPEEGVLDRHFHPVEPRQLRFAATWGL